MARFLALAILHIRDGPRIPKGHSRATISQCFPSTGRWTPALEFVIRHDPELSRIGCESVRVIVGVLDQT